MIIEENYKDGKLNGPQKYYYPGTSQCVRYREYVNGVLHGPWIEYFRSGKEKLHATYVNGRLEGPFIIYYPSGAIRRYYNYRNGKRHGKCSEYHENGELKVYAIYEDGRIIEVKVIKPPPDMDTLSLPEIPQSYSKE